jgi:hypothetical protein
MDLSWIRVTLSSQILFDNRYRLTQNSLAGTPKERATAYIKVMGSGKCTRVN